MTYILQELNNLCDEYQNLDTKHKLLKKKFVETYRKNFDKVYILERDPGNGQYYQTGVFRNLNDAYTYKEHCHKSDDFYHNYRIKEKRSSAVDDNTIWGVKL